MTDSNELNNLGSYLIPVKEAQERRNEYVNRQYQAITNTIPRVGGNKKYVETEYVWFPLDVMEKYLKDIKEIGGGNKVDGIRIYFGAYKDGTEDPSTRTYKNRQTVFMMPTIPSGNAVPDDENSKHDSIYLDNTGTIRPIDLSSTATITNESQMTTLNNGHAKPPPPWN